MSSSREDSPDWLRSFQAPTQSTIALSSDSLPNLSLSKLDDDDAEENVVSSADKNNKLKNSASAPRRSVWTLSSDSESSSDDSIGLETKKSQIKEDEDEDALGSSRKPPLKVSKEKSPKKRLKTESRTANKEKDVQGKGNLDDTEIAEEDTLEKHVVPLVSTSTLPLVLSEKVCRTKALVECEGDSIDLSGDMGAVGRIMIPDTPSGNSDMYLDLKGTIYRTRIAPSRTFCVVSFGQSEAKIEAIMDDFIQLKPESNVFEAETMVEGTLEGFSFDSDEEAEKIPKSHSRQADQEEGNEEQTNGKTKRKAEKSLGGAKKRGKTAGKPQPAANKAKKRNQASKKPQTSKKPKAKK